MKKALLSVATIVAFALYSWHARNEQQNAVKAVTSSSSQPQQNSTSGPSSQASQPTSSSSNNVSNNTSATSTKPSSIYKDGSFTGISADAVYGNIQVQVTISNGKITDLVFLSYPNDRSTSIEINQQAMPILKQEAIQAQSANVDTVSGATDSSGAFVQSLSSALEQAKA